MSQTLAFAQYLTFENETGSAVYYFQNYWVNEDAIYAGITYGFLPFAFSGVTVSKSGDNQPATLVLPNNALSRAWGETAVTARWIARVITMVINPDDKSILTPIATYVGQIVNSNWDTTSLQLEMASVLDAVGTDVPRKRLTQQLVGNLPLTSNVRLQ